MRSLPAIALATLACWPGVATGQADTYIPLVIQQNMESAALSQSIFNSMMATEAARGTAGSRAAPAADRTTRFTPVAPSLVPQTAHAVAKDAETARKMEEYATQALRDYESAARKRGVALHDVARAASFLVITAYEAYHDVALSEVAANAVREQFRARLLADDAFQRLPARTKQELYESYAIHGMTIANVYYPAREANLRAQLDRSRRMGDDALRGMFGVPGAAIELSTAGVRKR